MNEIDKLAWLHIKDKQLLVARSKGKDVYYIPGGKREHGENDQTALIREIKEELLIALLPETIAYAGTFYAQAHEKLAGTQVKITGYFAQYEGEIQAHAEIAETCWLKYDNNVKCSLATRVIMDWLKSKELIK